MFKKIKYSIILLLLLLCSAGCAGDKINEGSDATGMDTGSPAHVSASKKPYRVKQALPLLLEDEYMTYSQKTIYSGSYGGKLYILSCYYPENVPQPFYSMYVFDMDSLETEQIPFSLDLPEEEKYTVSYIESMYVTGENELTFIIYGSYEKKDTSMFLCRTDISGTCLDGESALQDITEPFKCSTLNNIYRYSAVTDNSLFLTEWEKETNTTHIYRYDTDTGKKHDVGTLSDEYVSSLCSNSKGCLYYVGSNNELKYMDIKTQSCEILCNLLDCGISPYSSFMLMINDTGELAIFTAEKENLSIYLLTNEAENDEDSDTIRLVRLNTYGMEYVSQRAGAWSNTSGTGCIKTEKADTEDKLEALRTRVMAEIVSGNGPELMWVSEDDMRMLAEKGALMDISELITKDVQEQLLPGVLQAGTVDGTLVGSTPEVSFYTLLAPASVWDKDSWTISDIMDLVESRNDWDWPFIFSHIKPSFDTLLYGMLTYNWGDTPFLDLENEISRFNSPEFIETLEFCKKYGEANNSITSTWDELYQMLRNGSCAALRCNVLDGLQSFSRTMERAGDCRIVGFPSTKGSGNYIYSEGYLVVNANAVHIDAIKDFIACLLDYDNQFTVSWCSVRKDVIQDRVVIMPITGKIAILESKGSDIYSELATKPDNTSYLEEFMAFAESCEPLPHCPQDIIVIITEELPSYFNNDRNAEETADVIHRRVQLYFNEQK